MAINSQIIETYVSSRGKSTAKNCIVFYRTSGEPIYPDLSNLCWWVLEESLRKFCFPQFCAFRRISVMTGTLNSEKSCRKCLVGFCTWRLQIRTKLGVFFAWVGAALAQPAWLFVCCLRIFLAEKLPCLNLVWEYTAVTQNCAENHPGLLVWFLGASLPLFGPLGQKRKIPVVDFVPISQPGESLEYQADYFLIFSEFKLNRFLAQLYQADFSAFVSDQFVTTSSGALLSFSRCSDFDLDESSRQESF